MHHSVAKAVVPMLNVFAEERKNALGVDKLRPWDKAVDIQGREPLKAFESGADLLDKGIECFRRVDAYLGECLQTMKEMGRFYSWKYILKHLTKLDFHYAGIGLYGKKAVNKTLREITAYRDKVVSYNPGNTEIHVE